METVARTPLQFGNEIRENRRKLGMTQEQLAARAGVRQRTVSDIESAGKARLDTVMRILAALNLELVVRVRTQGSAKDIEDIF